MSAQRLYKAEWVHDAEENYDYEMYGEPLSEPAGWREYAIEKWGTVPPENEYWPQGYKPFFWPSTDRIFRSRSAAQRRVDIINHWGGRAVLVECTPEWMTVSAANAQRKAKWLKDKRARVLEELAAVNDALRATEEGAS
ncbi:MULTISPECIES: hypothetical protein [unclassified Leucobacter]|uniref:hypothetical protein n=1 Tax=unclassified Leucobacter TaxID=2621730 RepID=UPI00301A1AD3